METTSWICDTCSQPLTEAKHGWVEWLVTKDKATGKYMHHGLRLVHAWPYSPLQKSAHRCQYDSNHHSVSDRSLEECQGGDGLMFLLLELHLKTYTDPEEVLRMIKRIHVPGYEATFRYFDAALAEGVFDPNTPENYFLESDMEAVEKWLSERKE